MSNIQEGGMPLRRGKWQLYMPTLVLVFLIVAIIVTTLTVFAISMHAGHTASKTAPVARKGTNHPVPQPTPIMVHSLPSPATPTPIPPAPTPTPAPVMSCQIAYTITNSNVTKNNNSNTFTANITVTNTGNVNFNNWTLTFVFPDENQDVYNVSSGNANFSEGNTSSVVIMTNVGNNATLAPGQSLTISIKGDWGDVNPAPTMFILNTNTLCH